jgi:hypothetical protein
MTPLQPHGTQTDSSADPAYHSHTLSEPLTQGSLSMLREQQLNSAGPTLQGSGVMLGSHSHGEYSVAPSAEPSFVLNSAREIVLAPSQDPPTATSNESAAAPPSQQFDPDDPLPGFVAPQLPLGADGMPALPDMMFFDLEEALASPASQHFNLAGPATPQIIDLTAVDDEIPDMTAEEVDAMIAVHQTYSSMDLWEL